MNQISQPASSSEDPSSGAHVEKRSQPETGNVGVQAEKSVLITIEQPRMIPWVCYGLIIFTAVVYFLQFVSQALLGADLPAALGVKSNEAIRTGEIWRLLTPVFLHGSLLHIGFNLYALYAIGPGLERHYGRLRFLMIYFLSAFTGNVLSYIFSPNPSLGASTAMFGLIAAQGIFIYRNRFLFGAKSRPMLANISGIIIINFILGLSPGIDNWGHLGGLIGGLGFAWFAGPRLVVSRNERGYFLLDQTAITVAWLTLLIEALLFSGLAVLV
jgi:rhomboid protease GluP